METCDSGSITVDVIKKGELPDKPTLKAPSFAIVDRDITVIGKTPEPNQEVWIEETSWFDEKIPGAQTTSDGEGNFEIEFAFEEMGMMKIASEIEKFGWNPQSKKQTVIVLDWWVIVVIVLIVAFIGYRMYKKRGKK